MESNFKELSNYIKTLNEATDIDTRRYLRDLNFFLIEAENQILKRETSQAAYFIRMIHDLNTQFIRHIIKTSNAPKYKLWYKKVKQRQINPSIYLKLQSMIECFPDNTGKVDIFGINNQRILSEIKNMHGWMHYKYDGNYKIENMNSSKDNNFDKSTLYNFRGQIRLKNAPYNELVNYIEVLWSLVINILNNSGILEKEIKQDFDPSIYDYPTLAFSSLLQNKWINGLVENKYNKCPICKKGDYKVFTKDDLQSVKFPYGAFVKCENIGCWATVGKTLKVKKDLKEKYDGQDAICPKCKTESVQKRFNFHEQESKVYLACKKCIWNNKNNEVLDDQIEDMIKEAEDDLQSLLNLEIIYD